MHIPLLAYCFMGSRRLFTPRGLRCPFDLHHGSIAWAASRPNHRWTLRLNALHSRCSGDNRPVQFLAAFSQSYPADYLHQCLLQLIRLYRYDDLAQRAWCGKQFSVMPVSGVLSPDVRSEFGSPIRSIAMSSDIKIVAGFHWQMYSGRLPRPSMSFLWSSINMMLDLCASLRRCTLLSSLPLYLSLLWFSSLSTHQSEGPCIAAWQWVLSFEAETSTSDSIPDM